MNSELKEIKNLNKENEKLRKESGQKYFENRFIESELNYINNIQDMRKNNKILSITISLLLFVSIYAGLEHIFDVYGISDILLFSGDLVGSLIVGVKYEKKADNKLLKDLNFDIKSINKKQKELESKKEENIILINKINKKLINNNIVLDVLHNEIKNRDYYNNNSISNNNVNNKTKKLSLKKII